MELNEMRRIAESATPGPWRIDKDSEQDYEQGIPYLDWPQTLVGPKNTQASQWTIDHGGEFMVDEINELSWPDAEFIATFDPPTVLALLSRLEQAEARVKLLESGIVSELVVTSVHSASAIGTTVSGISEDLLKLGYDGLTERLEQAEQAVQRVREFSRTMLVPHGQGVVVAARVKEALGRALDGDGRE